jgi:hypothetical protein
MLIAGEKTLHDRQIRLFHKAGDIADVGRSCKSVAHSNVAELRRRRRRAQTEQDKSSVPRRLQAARYRGPECRVVAHPMVDRHRKDHGIGI